MIPMIINKFKSQKVKLKRKRAMEKRFSGADDFADDLEDFFDWWRDVGDLNSRGWTHWFSKPAQWPDYANVAVAARPAFFI